MDTKELIALISTVMGEGNRRADPEKYLNVRLTDGERFYKALEYAMAAIGNASQAIAAPDKNASDASNNVEIAGGVYNSTAPTYANGDATQLQTDANGNLKTTLATTIAGEDTNANVMKVEQRFAYNYISTAATTVVKSSPGFLHSITVNGGTAGTIIIYDNTAGSGNIIASFDSTNALATYIFDVVCSTGITVVTSAATKVTVSYR